ncbi:MAG: hypothetical protein GX682_02415 [Clostridiaceae bacterium]|nr:hypothetical protein [Clostridiaceae bacterium]
MNKRNLLYIGITIICVIAIIMGIYYQIFKNDKKQNSDNNQITNIVQDENKNIDPEQVKEEFNNLFTNYFDDQGYDISSIKKIEGLEEKDIIYAAYNIQEEKEEKYNVNINLPVFNVQGDVASEFNVTTQSIFANKASDVLLNSKEYTIYNVEYISYLNENILSLVIKSTLKEGNNAQRVIVQTYNYDIQTGNKVTLNEILQAKGISQKEVNTKIETQVQEASKQSEAVANALQQKGQLVYKRDINNAMYVTDNVNYFFLGLDGQIYIIYPYGNSNFTSEMDIIKI